jgi:[glutamine synthetase] adenylyltransferase / [glutamine synthetase]-adenylyl-L-tyrosine phosphorylase
MVTALHPFGQAPQAHSASLSLPRYDDSMTEPQVPLQYTERFFQEWSDRAGEAALPLLEDAELMAALGRVFEGSEFVALACRRDPALLPALVGSGDLRRSYAAGELALGLRERLAGVADENALHRELRLFRRYQMVRIIWRDLARWAPLAETLEDLSELADVCVDQALELLYRWAVEKQGSPRDEQGREQRLVVLGMGKLGARELNLSSDIDLIFAYPAQGQVDGPRPIANEEFFARLCQQLMKAINNQTVDGFVFRVDARLRPFGDAGPLAFSFDAMEQYYQSQAREWERYAMIKARVVAGDRQAGAELMAMLRPFVYRRYLDFGAIESLRDMKQLISKELLKKGMAENVKLGPGGIREIEFLGQAFQLVRGGRDPDLQIRPILPVLRLLGEKGLLPPYAVQELGEAYEFLRLVENRVQAWRDQQTHLLPEDAEGRQRLARSMGFADWDGFYPVLQRHRKRVQGHFDQVFAAPQAEEGQPEQSPLMALWNKALDLDDALEILHGAGFPKPEATLEALQGFRSGHAFRALGHRGRQRLDQLMPLLLEAAGRSEAPGTTLERLLQLLNAIARRTAYIALLVENPLALSQLVRLSAASPWIASLLTRYPLLLDELLDPRRLYSPLQRRRLDADLEALLAKVTPEDLEQQMDLLRQFAQTNLLRVAAADITGVIPLMVVSDYLTWSAEAVTAQVLDLAWRHLEARHGRPSGPVGADRGLLVLGFGKLGGIELGYKSDLDLVFLHGNQAPNAMTAGPAPVSNEVFYFRVVQRMISLFTTRTGFGQLYEIDMRLRPNGASGLLVTSLAAFDHYERNEAWTWEHQALLRARPIAGDAGLAERFQAIRREVLGQPREVEQLRTEVREMRAKMRQSLDKGDAGRFDLKQGRGGIADIEFMVQYMVLRWAHQYPELLDWTDNIRQLDALTGRQILAAESARFLADAYRTFRAAYHRNALQDQPGLVPADAFPAERQGVAVLWEELIGGAA